MLSANKFLTQVKSSIKKFAMLRASKAHYKFILKDWTALNDLNAMGRVLETKRFSQNIDPIIVPRPEAKKALVIAPHPDDDIISSGGAMLKLMQGSSRVKVIYLTSSDKNSYIRKGEEALSILASEFEEDAKRVAGRLGTEIEFWRHRSMEIKIDRDTTERLRGLCMDLGPDIVFLPFIADDHDDHRRSVQLFYETFKYATDLNFDVWAYQVYSTVLPNMVLDVTDVIDKKMELINLCEARKRSRAWAHYARGLNAFNSRFLKTKNPGYAEVFFVLPAREYLDLCSLYFKERNKNIYSSNFYKKS